MRGTVVALLLSLPAALAAQEHVVTSPPITHRVPTATLAAGGVIGMGLGTLVGAGAGAVAGAATCSHASSNGPNLCGLGAAVLGAMAGECAGTAVGVLVADP